MQIYSFLFKWKKNCQPNFKKKVSLQFVRTVYVCSNQLVASFEEAKKNRMSQIENELETSRLLRDWYRIHKRELPWRGVFRPLYHLDIRDNPSTNTGGTRDGLFSPFYRTVPGCGFAGFGGGRRGVEILAGAWLL